jgi:hypothetical protein
MKYHRVCIISGISGEHCEISMSGKGVEILILSTEN